MNRHRLIDPQNDCYVPHNEFDSWSELFERMISGDEKEPDGEEFKPDENWFKLVKLSIMCSIGCALIEIRNELQRQNGDYV